MESNKRIPLSPGYHAEPGPTPGHQHDIYTTAPPFEGNRRHVGTLSKSAVEAWAASSTEMATALLFALEHDDDKDVADFLRDWMRGDTSRWFEFTAKYRRALAQKAALLASLSPSQEASASPWSFDMEAAPRDGTSLDLWCRERRYIDYRWDAEGRSGGWWSDTRHKDRHWRDREFLVPGSVTAWRLSDVPASSGQGGR